MARDLTEGSSENVQPQQGTGSVAQNTQSTFAKVPKLATGSLTPFSLRAVRADPAAQDETEAEMRTPRKARISLLLLGVYACEYLYDRCLEEIL